jgi:hypothetical protein
VILEEEEEEEEEEENQIKSNLCTYMYLSIVQY